MAVSNLSPFQQALQSVVGTGKGADSLITPDILGRVADQIFGPFPIPPGSQIVFQGPDRAEWIDADGFRHVATRSLDGRDPSAGQVREQTDRPPILQSAGPELQSIRDLTARLQQPAQLAALDPQTQAALEAITQNTMAQLKQQFERDQANQLASLFGNRIQSSSIATNALGQLLQNQGLVTSQALSDAAGRELGTRQFLTDTNRTNLATALQGLLGGAELQTQRDIATGGLNLDFARLGESARQANQGFELGQQDADLRLAESRSVLNKILKGLQVGGPLAGGIGTLIGAIPRGNRAAGTANIGGIAGLPGF